MSTEQAIVFSLVFLLGLAFGSFLNVVIYRMGSGFGLSGRSKCFSCGKTLAPRMLIPLLSYLWQRGKCAYCNAKVSLQYALVELLTGALFVALASANHLGISNFSIQSAAFFVLDCTIVCLLVLITVYDLRHKIIPDKLSFLLATVAGIEMVLKYYFGIFPERYIPIFDHIPAWLDLAAAPLLFLPFALLWFFSAGRAMGFGDAKLAWGLGWFLGFAGGVSAVILAFWIALIPSIGLLFLRGNRFTMKSEIPFAPFLVLGALTVHIFGINILAWSL